MSMMMRRGMMVPKAPGGLPSEYLQVQYIQGTGTQYIDVDTTPKGYEFEITFMITATRADGAMVTGYSTWNDANAWSVFQTSSALQVRRRYGVTNTAYDAVANVSDILNKKITASAYKTYAEIYDEETGTTINKNTEDCSSSIRFYNSTVTLFRGESDYGYSARRVKARIYSAKYYLNGILAYDLVPCVRIADSKPGMYDLVGRQFYVNAGTGEFVVGWYVSDGLIFNMDGADRGGVSGEWTDKVGGYTFEIPSEVTETQLGVTFPSNSTQHIRYDGDAFPTIVDDAYKTITTEYCYSEVSTGYGQNIFILQSVGLGKPCAHVSNSQCVYTNKGSCSRANGVVRGTSAILSVNEDRGYINGIQAEMSVFSGNAGSNNRYTTIGSNQGLSYRFRGTIHSIRVYNRKLTEAEMLQNQRVDNFRYQLGLTI